MGKKKKEFAFSLRTKMVVLFKGLNKDNFSKHELTVEKAISNGPNLKLATTQSNDDLGCKLTVKHSINAMNGINVELNVNKDLKADGKVKLSPVNNVNVEIK